MSEMEYNRRGFLVYQVSETLVNNQKFCFESKLDSTENQEQLLEKAIKIHPDDTFPTLDELTNKTSLFRNPDTKNSSLR